jgi:hypothetical protein
MNKIRSLLIMSMLTALAALLLPCGLLFSAPDFDTREVNIALHDRSELDWVNISIDGENRGIARKGEALVVRLRVGASFSIFASRLVDGKMYTRERIQLIERGQDRQWVVLLPELQNSDRVEPRGYAHITLSADAEVPWANITINNVSYGMLRRGETHRFWLKSDMEHSIRLEHRSKGLTYIIEKTIEIREGQIVSLSISPQQSR